MPTSTDNGNLNKVANTIRLKSRAFLEEGYASLAIDPGMLLMLDPANPPAPSSGFIYPGNPGNVQPHNSLGAKCERLFAEEDALQGFGINNSYASADLVQVRVCHSGDVMQALLPANAPAITYGDPLVSNGDGTLIKSTLPGTLVTDILYDSLADSSVVTNTNVETLYDKNFTAPANLFQVGDVLRIRARVKITGVNSTNTFTLKLKIGGVGGTTIAATAAVNPTVNDEGFFDAVLTIRTIGAAGTFVASGTQGLGTPGTVTALPWQLESTTLNTTITQQLGVSVTMSVANAGNTSVLREFVITLDRGTIGGSVIAFSLATLDNSAVASRSFIPVRIAG